MMSKYDTNYIKITGNYTAISALFNLPFTEPMSLAEINSLKAHDLPRVRYVSLVHTSTEMREALQQNNSLSSYTQGDFSSASILKSVLAVVIKVLLDEDKNEKPENFNCKALDFIYTENLEKFDGCCVCVINHPLYFPIYCIAFTALSDMGADKGFPTLFVPKKIFEAYPNLQSVDIKKEEINEKNLAAELHKLFDKSSLDKFFTDLINKDGDFSLKNFEDFTNRIPVNKNIDNCDKKIHQVNYLIKFLKNYIEEKISDEKQKADLFNLIEKQVNINFFKESDYNKNLKHFFLAFCFALQGEAAVFLSNFEQECRDHQLIERLTPSVLLKLLPTIKVIQKISNDSQILQNCYIDVSSDFNELVLELLNILELSDKEKEHWLKLNDEKVSIPPSLAEIQVLQSLKEYVAKRRGFETIRAKELFDVTATKSLPKFLQRNIADLLLGSFSALLLTSLVVVLSPAFPFSLTLVGVSLVIAALTVAGCLLLSAMCNISFTEFKKIPEMRKKLQEEVDSIEEKTLKILKNYNEEMTKLGREYQQKYLALNPFNGTNMKEGMGLKLEKFGCLAKPRETISDFTQDYTQPNPIDLTTPEI